MRIGHGFDVHKFTQGDFITLGGVRIPYQQGLLAHSDGDVALHALTDALLGAAALGDIGQHFPDTDPQYKDKDSRTFVRAAIDLLRLQHWTVGNIDITILAEAPKLATHIPTMCECIALDCGLDVNQVNVKATTTEGLGFVGEKQGIAVHAVVLLQAAAKPKQ